MGHPTFIRQIIITLKDHFSKKKDSLQDNKLVVLVLVLILVVAMTMVTIMIMITFYKMSGKAFEAKPENSEGKRIHQNI